MSILYETMMSWLIFNEIILLVTLSVDFRA